MVYENLSKAQTEERAGARPQLLEEYLPIDVKATACHNSAKTTAEQSRCWQDAGSQWTAVLHSAENSFKKESSEERASRIAAQKFFSVYQQAENNSVEQIYVREANRGEVFQPAVEAANSDLARDRAIQLQNLAGDDSNGSIQSRLQYREAGEQTSYMDKLSKAIQETDKILNEDYKQLMSRLSPEGQKALRKSERAWISFRDAEFKHIDKHLPGSDLSARTARTEAKLDLMQNRAETLERQLSIAIEAGEKEPD